MKIKQQVSLTPEEVVKIISKFIENKTKKKVVSADFAALTFALEDSDLEEQQPTK